MMIMYVVVNSKLTKSQRIPQASHAVAEFMFRHREDNVKDWIENHRTMVVLQADDSIIERYKESGLKYEVFIDDDLDNMLTAVAFEPMSKERGSEMFGGIKLA